MTHPRPDGRHDSEKTHPAAPPPTPDRRALLAGIGGLAAGALLVGTKAAQAGPLSPPAGPVASTGKTLVEVEPRIAINSTNTPGSSATSSVFRITQSGSYYLTGNIISTSINRHVIVVAASGVTIDLNGFVVRGLGTIQGAFDGIFAEAGVEHVTVRNGYVELAGRDGINLDTSHSSSVENVVVSSCVSHGIGVGASSSVVGCRAVSNASRGIDAGDGSTISGCSASTNGSKGIDAGSRCVIRGCTAHSNGDTGITALSHSLIDGCTSIGNANNGIFTYGSCTISGCAANNNNETGIILNSSSTARGCMANANGNDGISANRRCNISGCIVNDNTADGILLFSQNIVSGNTCANNGNGGDGAGIRAFPGSASDNLIEGNNCTGNDRGIDVDGTGNIIIKNSCSGNTTNYVIAANNRYGPIVNITASGTAAVNGNSATSTIGSTDPHANFAY